MEEFDTYRYVVPKYKIPVNRRWIEVDESDLTKMRDKEPKRYHLYDQLIGEYQRNPLAFFLPHGRPQRCGQKRINDVTNMCSDYVDDLILLTAPNQVGKSFQGAAFIGLRVLPCDPTWPVFTQHYIKYKPWTGPKQVIVASYSWDNVQVVWETYLKLLPRHELREYAPNYGMFEGEDGKAKTMTFGDGRSKSVTLACGTKFTFLAYTQSITHWESRQCDIAHLDEQCDEAKFDALTARMITRGTYTPIIMTLTGHVIDGRPDTGAGGWIKKTLVDGNGTKGRKLAHYRISIPDVPNAIISEIMKAQLKRQWVEEPTRNNNFKKLREGDARYWGGWEEASGLVLDCWNSQIHMIEPFDFRKYRPTYYRMIDHGYNPCAALLIAVLPTGDAVVYKEYYEFGHSIAENSKRLVALSGNKISRIDDVDVNWDVYEENQTGTQFYRTELDPRSFATKSGESGKPIGQLYNEGGLRVIPASGMHRNVIMSNLKEWMEITPGKTHLNLRLGRTMDAESVAAGAPKLYFFNDLVNTRKEIEGWTFNARTGKPKDADDHLISCLLFFTALERPYMGNEELVDERDSMNRRERENVRNNVTGY